MKEALERPSSIYKSEAIDRATRSLACFTPLKPRWSLEELAQATKAPKNTLAGILNTLVARHMLRRNEAGEYELGYAWLRLGRLRQTKVDTRAAALPIMRRIREAVNETVILSLRVGDQRIHLDYVESTQTIRRLAQAGSAAPLHVGAAGMALLANLPEWEKTDYLERLKPALKPVKYKQIVNDIALVEARGFASVLGTVNADTAAVSAAGLLHSGECVSITISAPTERFDRDRDQERFAGLVIDAMGQLLTRLGAAR
ncbi:MAG: transcriptional regulator, IclR family [Acidimicrobiales bacterium]|nr:transcriptional regulator, IclR family [Acidimicrobiales bacterium]